MNTAYEEAETLRVVRDIWRPRLPVVKPLTLEEIVTVACAALEMPVEYFYGKERTEKTVSLRMLVWACARRYTPLSYPEIAEQSGKTGHSTVITSLRRASERMDEPLRGYHGKGTLAELMDLVFEAAMENKK